MKTGIVKDWRYLDHDMGPHHVENPARLQVIYQMIEADPALAQLTTIKPREATEEEIELVHTRSYIKQLQETKGKTRVILDPDTSTCALSYDTARLAVGGVIEAARLIMEREIEKAIALIRPPGHHAEASRAMGFCLFNNVAIAARWLRKEFDLERILIIDWDLHHGNGTQHTFYREKEVLYFSTHQYPYYPGTGYWDEVGDGNGEGFTFNVPLSPGKRDNDYCYIFQEILTPLTLRYRPEFVLVSAGFDILQDDPLGGMMLTAEGLAGLTAQVINLAQAVAQGRLLLVLEGGYSLVGLKNSLQEVLYQLAGLKPPPPIKTAISTATEKELAPAFTLLHRYWK